MFKEAQMFEDSLLQLGFTLWFYLLFLLAVKFEKDQIGKPSEN